MAAADVVELLAAFARRGIRAWVAGGWAVDAVVGHQTRPHGDLDLAVDAAQLDDLLALLREDGFAIAVDQLPARVGLAAPDGRRVDLHPVRFAADGSGLQAGRGGAEFAYAADGFSWGAIAGASVPCLGIAQQLRFRGGYDLRDVDRHDLPLLRGGSFPEPASVRKQGPEETRRFESRRSAAQTRRIQHFDRSQRPWTTGRSEPRPFDTGSDRATAP